MEFLQLFFPFHVAPPDKNQGIVVGWKRKNVCTVACIIQQDRVDGKTLQKLDHYLALDPRELSILDGLGGPVDILGIYCRKEKVETDSVKKDFWLELGSDGTDFTIINCYENGYLKKNLDTHIYSFETKLNVFNRLGLQAEYVTPSENKIINTEKNEKSDKNFGQTATQEKMIFLTIQFHASPRCKLIIENYMSTMKKEFSIAGIKKGGFYRRWCQLQKEERGSYYLVDIILSFLAFYCTSVLSLLDRIIIFSKPIKSISYSCNIVYRDCYRLKKLIGNYKYARKNINEVVGQRRIKLELINDLTRHTLDVSLGLFVVYLFICFEFSISKPLYEFQSDYDFMNYSRCLKWLKGMPGGLKLNTPLSHFLGNIFIQYLSWWKNIAFLIHSFLPTKYVTMLLFCGGFGCTKLLAVLIDLFRLLTLHSPMLANISRQLFETLTCHVFTLYRHFCGKKWNVLRQRTDSCDFGVDQRLVNTLLFTTFLLLLPTVAVYYYCMSMLALIRWSTINFMILVVEVLNRFSWLSLFLYSFFPFFLPARLFFKLPEKLGNPLELNIIILTQPIAVDELLPSSGSLRDDVSGFDLPLFLRSFLLGKEFLGFPIKNKMVS